MMTYGDNMGLVDQFGVPPFSILDTKQGYWQRRKKYWKSIGINSEVGRADELTFDVSGSRNWFVERLQKSGGMTSIFDPFLCELMYKWFMPKRGGKILDPFAGGSVRGVVATLLGYEYTGIELRPEQVEANYKNVNEEIKNEFKIKPIWMEGNSIDIDKIITEKFDFIFSCPPYYDLEVYSKLRGELSAKKTYKKFLASYDEIIAKTCAKLKNNRFACFVVSEVREQNNVGYYRNFVGDTVNAFLKADMEYYNEMILVNAIGSLPVRCAKQFNSTRKIGSVHQNILVFYKGDIEKIKDIFEQFEVPEEKAEVVSIGDDDIW